MNLPYTLLMLLAVVTALLISRRTQRGLPLARVERVGVAIGAFCGAMIGAKLPFVLSDWEGLKSGIVWFGDGKTIVLGLVGGYLGVEVAKWALEIRTKTGDSFVLPVAVGVAIGRLACFVGGCCYGTPTDLPWGVRFADGLPRHPTQLYEMVFHLLAAAVLVWLRAEGWFRGQLIKLYILAYLVYRFLTEYIRPEAPQWQGLTGYQWATLAAAPLFVYLWWRDSKSMAADLASQPSAPA